MAAQIMAPMQRRVRKSGVLNDIAKVGEIIGPIVMAIPGGQPIGAAITAGSGAADALSPDAKVEEIQQKLPQATNNLDVLKRRLEMINKGQGGF